MSHVALDFSVTGIDHPCPASYGLVSFTAKRDGDVSNFDRL